jgi:hypothetical protein
MVYQLNHCRIQLSSQNNFVILTILRGTWIALNSIAIKIRNINNKFCNQEEIFKSLAAGITILEWCYVCNLMVAVKIMFVEMFQRLQTLLIV